MSTIVLNTKITGKSAIVESAWNVFALFTGCQGFQKSIICAQTLPVAQLTCIFFMILIKFGGVCQHHRKRLEQEIW